ncbi:hypothetical protein CP8484711_2816, partial [Chlamydia psittaci 84-8471/1]
VFALRIINLSENQAFSLRESPIYAKITNFLFSNSPFKRKSHVFSSEILHLTRKSRVFSTQIPHLSKKHRFSFRKSHTYA